MTQEFVSILIILISQGFIYSLVVMGVYFSSRVVSFDDLTTEGSFGFGGALTATLITMGVSPWITLPIALFSGLIAGSLTGFLHTKLKINNLISGLVVTTALFSISLKLAHANVTLPERGAIFAVFSQPEGTIILLGILVSLMYLSLKGILNSEIGLVLRAVGNNPQMVTSIGKDVEMYKILGLAIANGATALAGCLFVQWSGFFSITGNVGTLVIGLAGLILAELIRSSFGLSLIVGAILYQAIFALTIELELDPVWNNLIKAVLIVLLLQIKSQNRR